MDRGPTAYAVGCILAPLCGFCLRAAFLLGLAAVAYEWLAACVRVQLFSFFAIAFRESFCRAAAAGSRLQYWTF
jgi:hypothetical protein